MKQRILALVIVVLGLASCSKQPETLTKAQIQAKADSVTAYRIKELDEQAKLELEHRMKIEVKVKVDSIVNAALHPADTTQTKKPVLN